MGSELIMTTGELMEEDDNVQEIVGTTMAMSSDVECQVTIAQRYPRSIKNFRSEVSEMACLDEETAASMFYALPRGGKKIEGPSARFAEIVGAAYGNLRYGARIVGIEGNFIVAEGVCFDTQKNVSMTIQVRRRITNSAGVKFNDDMIQVTGNAACSIALRNAIFKVVPFSLVKEIYEDAKKTSLGKAMSTKERRTKAMEWFAKAGVTEQTVLESLGRKGVDDIDMDDLITLRGLMTAIKEGEVSIESAFENEAAKRGVQRADTTPKAAAKKTAPVKEKTPKKSTLHEEYERLLLASSANRETLIAKSGEMDADDNLTAEEKTALSALVKELLKA